MRVAALLTVATLVLAACATPGAQPTEAPKELTKVTLQLQWVTQSQFAGYYAAVAKGFYKDEGLDVTIKEGAVDIVPQQVLASGQADFAVSWVPKALVSREEGAKIVNIAQVFQRSGTLQVSWADAGITKPEDWRGKKVGTWGFGNEFELLAAITRAGLDKDKDLEIVSQNFDMNALLNREIDAAQAMTYNEYAQVLEAINPATGQLYQPSDLVVIDYNQVGTAMLQDAVWAREDWLADAKNQDIAVRFLRATFKGWIFCRDNFDECVQIVLDAGPTLGKGHMTWQLNEINKLIWPSPADGIGVMDKALWDQTVEVAVSTGNLKAAPDAGSYRDDLARKAAADLKAAGLDVAGANYAPRQVEVTEGGK
jgi:NitT/TauT family transport system substrate-binding protein